MLHKAWSSIEEVPYCFWRSSVKFQGHSAKKNRRFWPKLGVSRLKNRRFESNLSKITRPVAAIKSLRFALLWENQWITTTCFSIKKLRNSYYKDKMASWPSDLCDRNSFTRTGGFNMEIEAGYFVYVFMLDVSVLYICLTMLVFSGGYIYQQTTSM